MLAVCPLQVGEFSLSIILQRYSPAGLKPLCLSYVSLRAPRYCRIWIIFNDDECINLVALKSHRHR